MTPLGLGKKADKGELDTREVKNIGMRTHLILFARPRAYEQERNKNMDNRQKIIAADKKNIKIRLYKTEQSFKLVVSHRDKEKTGRE